MYGIARRAQDLSFSGLGDSLAFAPRFNDVAGADQAFENPFVLTRDYHTRSFYEVE